MWLISLNTWPLMLKCILHFHSYCRWAQSVFKTTIQSFSFHITYFLLLCERVCIKVSCELILDGLIIIFNSTGSPFKLSEFLIKISFVFHGVVYLFGNFRIYLVIWIKSMHNYYILYLEKPDSYLKKMRKKKGRKRNKLFTIEY